MHNHLILTLLAVEAGCTTASAVSARTELPLHKVRRLLVTLRQLGHVAQLADLRVKGNVYRPVWRTGRLWRDNRYASREQ